MKESARTTQTLHVSGMHCTACTILIKDSLEEQGMRDVRVSLRGEKVTFVPGFEEELTSLAERLSNLFVTKGYVFSVMRQKREHRMSDWLFAVPVALLFIVGFFSLERFGAVSLLSGRDASLTTALVVGLIASVSSCLAVVGSLVLSLSATYAHAGAGMRPHVLFHVGRLSGFFLLGGLLGLVGDVFHIGLYGSALLGALVSIVMLLLGLQLLEISPHMRVPTLSRSVFDTLRVRAGALGPYTPLLIGAATFFLPCGFTQSMQVVALASGSALTGALTMAIFTVGTFPVLALLSFGSFDLAKGRFRGAFFKTAGVLVVFFALFNLYHALPVLGII